MTLNDIWESFAEKMAQVELLHRTTKESSKNELQKLARNAKAVENDPKLKELSSSIDNLMFKDAISGETRFYGFRERTIEENYLHVLLHKNKQYQWLLAEAYEAFEDFLENIYAFYGMSNHSFWPLSDFGNITINDLPQKDFSFFQKQAKNKKGIPHSILKQFRMHFPDLVEIEKSNKYGLNLAVGISLIEKLRHIIVHNNGIVNTRADFIKTTLETVGLFNNGKFQEEHGKFINAFFGSGEYENLITLLEIRIKPEIPIDMHISMFEKLTSILLAYASALNEKIKTAYSTTLA